MLRQHSELPPVGIIQAQEMKQKSLKIECLEKSQTWAFGLQVLLVRIVTPLVEI